MMREMELRERIEGPEKLLIKIIYKGLNLYRYVRNITEERLARKLLEWYPIGRKIKGRPRNSRMQKVTTGMSGKMEKKNKIKT